LLHSRLKQGKRFRPFMADPGPTPGAYIRFW